MSKLLSLVGKQDTKKPQGSLMSLVGDKPITKTIAKPETADVAFVNTLKKTDRGYLTLVFDATGSRAHTWRESMGLMHEMFDNAGQLNVRLIRYDGSGVRDLGWFTEAPRMIREMQREGCIAGSTSIQESLLLASEKIQEGQQTDNIVLVGDHIDGDHFSDPQAIGAELRQRKMPVYSVQELTFGTSAQDTGFFRTLAKESGGAYFELGKFKLRDILQVAAARAVGGVEAVKRLEHNPAAKLLALTYK